MFARLWKPFCLPVENINETPANFLLIRLLSAQCVLGNADQDLIVPEDVTFQMLFFTTKFNL